MKANRCRKRRLSRIANTLVSVITLILFSAGAVFALPAGQQVVNGQAAFNTQGNNLTITNSPNAIINWQGFSINNNEAVRFNQQYGSSAVLNRVIGQDPSRILGLLQSNGRVFLINPNGILFGQGARIDVNGLLASTLNIGNQDFLAGKYNFTAGIAAGSIQNQGTITTPEGGRVYLIAPDIENSGIINSPKGDVILAAGHSVQLVDSLDPDISVVVSAPENKAVNLGQIVAQSGKVGIYGGLISQKGVVNADSAIVGENGRIFFKASKDVTLNAGSTTSAEGGGTISVFADKQDGTVNVAGTLDASAPNGGNGGFIETSAATVKTADAARITTLAPYGKAGTWLIDPNDFTIAASGGDVTGATLGNNLGSGNVTILSNQGATSGNGDIFVNDTVSWTADTALSLQAVNNINVNNAITAGAGSLNFNAGGNITLGANVSTYGGIVIQAVGDVIQNVGSITNQLADPTILGSNDISISGNNIILRSVGSQRDVVITAGGSLTIATANLTLTSLLGPLNFLDVDDQYFSYTLPFSFPFYGTTYTKVYISSNGMVTFAEPQQSGYPDGFGWSEYVDSVSGLANYKIIAAAWNDWMTSTSPRHDIYAYNVSSGGNSGLAIRWDVYRFSNMSRTAQLEMQIFSNGNIKFNYGPASEAYGASTQDGDVTIGLSNQSSASTIVSALMNLPNFNMNYMPSTTFTYNAGNYTETVSSQSDWIPANIVGNNSGGGVSAPGGINAVRNVNITATNGSVINDNIDSSVRNVTAANLFINAMSGIGSGNPLTTAVQNISALNTTTNNIEIDNTGVLAVSGLSNGGTGNVILQNVGAITTDTSAVSSSGGAVSITAHSPLTIGSGGVSASGNISLEALPSGGSDDLAVNGNITSSNGNIVLSAGSSIVIGPGGSLSAPNGTITLTDGLNSPSTSTGILAVTGNETATDNTVSSLMTAIEKIVSVEKGEDEDELKKKAREGGKQTTDDKKTDDSVKKYCN